MGLSLYNLKKWVRMFSGRSILHVNQDLGKCFSSSELCGYYNNMTQKVLMIPELLGTDELPKYRIPSDKDVYFPVGIFQYGLGAYDLWLLTKDEKYKEKFLQSCDWSVKNQEDSGAWNNFFFKHPHAPYGAMAQGEACSLLLRGYKETNKIDYLHAAKKAIDFMLLPLQEGGTTKYDGEDVILMEYTHLPPVLNGWIFAWWGLYDWVLATDDNAYYKEILMQAEESIARHLSDFSCPYWSCYDSNGKLTSPFYHNLHIAQMHAMGVLTGRKEYEQRADVWAANASNRYCKCRSIVGKAWQKLREKEEWQ